MNENAELREIISKADKKARKKKWPCFFPGCMTDAIGSHSQTKNSSLDSIAVDGHVVERDFSIFPSGTKLGWKEVGINKATKFPGFCNQHDTRLFRQADSLGKSNLNPKALTMLSFRTFALEMRKKEISADRIRRLLLHKDKFPNTEAIAAMYEKKVGMEHCLRVTKPHVLGKYQRSILGNDFSLITHKVFQSIKNLGISCSTFINPVTDREWPLEIPQPNLTFNVLPRKDYTLVILSFSKSDSELIPEFIQKFGRLEDLIFNFCEEITITTTTFN